MVNVDFTVAELDSDAAWLKSAGAENYQYNQSMQQLQDAMREKGGMAGGFGAGDGNGGMPGGEGDGYAWSQTDDEVEMVVEVPEGTKAKDVKVAFKSESVEVVVGGTATTKAERLYRRVRPDECTWTIEGGRRWWSRSPRWTSRCGTPWRRSSERYSRRGEERREASRTRPRALASVRHLPSLCFVRTSKRLRERLQFVVSVPDSSDRPRGAPSAAHAVSAIAYRALRSLTRSGRYR